ncbi:MAG: carboxypeptidase regulatory-like domain-containing protein [Gammaproteobacteria bacterium]|nr:carboxypeptidase regulatory-like domain-containing protein [Gammaproteobacteria bacterium]
MDDNKQKKTTLRRCLLWIGVLCFLGIVTVLTERLLTDQPEKSVARPDAGPQPAPEPENPDPYLQAESFEAVVPSHNVEHADSLPASSDLTREENSWQDTASAWGSLYTKYGDVVANEKIGLISESANKVYSETSDENGFFSFEHIVPASDYRLTVSPKGMYQRVSMDSLAILDHQVTLTVVLQPLESGTLRGKVVNTENIVVPGYEMKIQSSLKSRWKKSFVPDVIGEFEIENVPIGPVEFTKTFGQALVISGHEFSGDSQTTIQLVVDVGYNELTGVVYDEFYNVVPGATVVLNWKHNYQGAVSIVTRRSTASPTGEFLFQGIGKGEHELLASTFDGLVGRQIIDIGSDNSERVVVVQRKRLGQD